MLTCCMCHTYHDNSSKPTERFEFSNCRLYIIPAHESIAAAAPAATVFPASPQVEAAAALPATPVRTTAASLLAAVCVAATYAVPHRPVRGTQSVVIREPHSVTMAAAPRETPASTTSVCHQAAVLVGQQSYVP